MLHYCRKRQKSRLTPRKTGRRSPIPGQSELISDGPFVSGQIPFGASMRQLTFALLASTTLAFVSQGASAADLARRPPVVKAPVAPVVPMTWTGCYLGGNIGFGWTKKEYSRPANGANDGFHTADGFVGGGQVGCDYQFAGNWV